MTTLAALQDGFGAFLIAALPANARTLVRGLIGEGPAPASPYIVYGVENFAMPSFMRTENTETEQIIRANTPVTMRVTVVGDRAGASVHDDAARLAMALHATQRTADLYKICGLFGTEPMQDLSKLEVGTMRARSDFRVLLSVPLDLTAPREVFDEVELTVTEPVKQFDKSIIVEGP
jgi:hypothetical protein